MAQTTPSRPSPLARRGLVGAAAAAGAAVLAGCGGTTEASASTAAAAATSQDRDDATTLTAAQARTRLEQGNARFVAGGSEHPDSSTSRRSGLVAAQAPFAAVLSCADSRVPPELVFDQGLGDLFTIRSAGQVTDHAVMGSIEYAVEHAGVPLLVVLGHSGCGAVTAALDAVTSGSAATGTDIDTLVDAITPSVRQAQAAAGGTDEASVLQRAVEANVSRVVEQVDADSVVTTYLGSALTVAGAVYDLSTGTVTWL